MKKYDPSDAVFQSFWQAGFECADHLNYYGNRVDLLEITAHDVLVQQDYQALNTFNITTVREGIRWNKVEKTPGIYNWTEVIDRIEAGKNEGIQQLWDICHFGFPDDLSPFHPHFARRLAAVTVAFAKLYRSITDQTLIITPINEISFLSWLGGERKGTIPYLEGRGFQVKYELVKAAIASIKAVREINVGIKILLTEPLVYILPWSNSNDHITEAAKANEEQFQTIDMLTGKMCPELGGSLELVDIIGMNFYYNNQWEHHRGRIQWEEPRDPRWKPLSILLSEVYQRYHIPMSISETSHLGHGRGEWILDIAQECKLAIDSGVPILGICLYPIIDRPDWDHLAHYHNSGLWDANLEGKVPQRVLCEDYAKDLMHAQTIIGEPKQEVALNFA